MSASTSKPAESNVNEEMEALMQRDVKGALLISAEGMCIASRGQFNPSSSGRCTQVMTSAFRLHNAVYPPATPDEVFLPTVTIETDQSIIVINSSNGYYTAISYPGDNPV